MQTTDAGSEGRTRSSTTSSVHNHRLSRPQTTWSMIRRKVASNSSDAAMPTSNAARGMPEVDRKTYSSSDSAA